MNPSTLKPINWAKARNIMKEDSHKTVANKKEDEAIKKEIVKLKQLLEKNRMLKHRELENNIDGKSKNFMVVPKFTKQHTKLRKRFESYGCFWEDNMWFERRNKMTMETKITSNRIPFDVKVYLKKQQKEIVDDFLQPASCNGKGSIISCEDEINYKKNLVYLINSEKNAKSNIMQRYLKNISKSKIISQNAKERAKCTVHIVKQTDLLKRDRKEIRRDNSLNKAVCMDNSKPILSSEIPPYRCCDKKKLEEAWKIWRNFTSAEKQRKKEREAIEYKIEVFLTRIQKRIEVENLVKQESPEKKPENFKVSKMGNKNLKGRMKTREKMNEREKNLTKKDDEKETNLKEIMGEIKTSQEEMYERLLSIDREGKSEKSKVLKILANVSENVDKTSINFPIPKFLLRMEKRQEERRKLWKNIRERKKKVEEERKNVLKGKEKQMKAIEEFSKRRKLQEVNERKKVYEEKRKKEKLKIKLAEVHYKRVLLRSYGLRPWLYLMNLRNVQQLRALNFFKQKVMRRVFTRWKIFVRNQEEEIQIKIKNIYRNILQKNCLKVWKKIREERIKQYQVATDLYDLKITEKIFTKWLKFTQEEQLDHFKKIETADLHYTKKLKVTFLRKWKNYREIQRFETAKEERKRIWRQKVKQILPDYQPVKFKGNS